MTYLIGVDIGTSATKTVLFDENMQVRAEASASYPLSQPQNGWAEQQPTDWAQAALTTIRDCVTLARVPKEEIRGIGLSGQMHGLVMLDAAGEVIRPAIIWCDQRTAKECEEITEKVVPFGVFTLPRPVHQQSLIRGLSWMKSARELLRTQEKKTLSVEEKMEEIRLVNRAKWLLISQAGLSEAEAHRVIEKRAMDHSISRRKVAEDIITTYT